MVHTPTYASVISLDSIAYIEAHYRTTFDGQPANKATVVFGSGTRAQLAHTHHVTDLTRFGDGICHSCGLNLWSPSWLAEDVFGEGTSDYMRDRIRAWVERVNHDHLALHLPAILASMSDSEPAVVTLTPVTA